MKDMYPPFKPSKYTLFQLGILHDYCDNEDMWKYVLDWDYEDSIELIRRALK